MPLANLANVLGGGNDESSGVTAGSFSSVTSTGGTFSGANGQTIVGNASGAWTVTANGSNQPITLVTSGTGAVVFPDGAAATPSVAFTTQSNKGFFGATTNEVGVSISGAQSMRFAAGGILYGGTVNNSLVLDATGGVALSAAGTNKDITLTPSGTGRVTSAAIVVGIAGTTAQATFRIPHGAAPTSPVDGDFWSTASTLNFRLSGVTKSITMI